MEFQYSESGKFFQRIESNNKMDSTQYWSFRSFYNRYNSQRRSFRKAYIPGWPEYCEEMYEKLNEPSDPELGK